MVRQFGAAVGASPVIDSGPCFRAHEAAACLDRHISGWVAVRPPAPYAGRLTNICLERRPDPGGGNAQEAPLGDAGQPPASQLVVSSATTRPSSSLVNWVVA